MLNSMQKDVLVEIMNTNIGLAASILSEMTNQKVLLSIPDVDLVDGADFVHYLNEREALISLKNTVISCISFGKVFCGKAYIFFPLDKAKALVGACLGEVNLDAYEYENLNIEDFDVLKEISNVILNTVTGELGNLLNEKLEYTTLDIWLNTESNFEETELLSKIDKVLVLYTSFFLAKDQIRGLILISLSLQSISTLIEKIDEFLRDVDV
jgi:chemotaxis protein CheC